MDLKLELRKRKKTVDLALKKSLFFKEESRLYQAMRHLPLAGGKRLRPIIAMLSSELIGGKKQDMMPFAIALELAHNFTLVHDDLMDMDSFRRGVETVHVKFDQPVAIIAGDALFALAFEELSKLDVDKKTLKAIFSGFSSMVREIAEGQQMDMNFESREDVDEEEYLKMIQKKTARIIQTAAWGGCMIGGCGDKEAESMKNYGKNLGLGFQIRDDIMGIIGESRITGKPVGNDIRRGKKTLPIVHALSKLDGEEKKSLLKMLGKEKASKKEINRAINLLKKTDSITYAERKATMFADNAKKALSIFPQSNPCEILKEIADYAVRRKR